MMKKRIIHLPIEPYKARATEYQSVEGGLYESAWRSLGIDFLSIRPDSEHRSIDTGLVLDALSRTAWGFQQVTELLTLMRAGRITPYKDVIFNEDFWLPGFEMIAYGQCMIFGYDVKCHVPVYSYSHAQTPDPNDFTYPMRHWMRDMERGWLKYNRGIFCAAKEMIGQYLAADMPLYGHIVGREGETRCKMHVVGHVWDTSTVLRLTGGPKPSVQAPKLRSVVYSSRWDAEKNPRFFLELVDAICLNDSEVTFHVCTGNATMKSNDGYLLEALHNHRLLGRQLLIHTDMSKAEYFKLLHQSKVQFNCASQDFISYTLLEAALYHCFPLYPRWLTFPDALSNYHKYLYTPGSLAEACTKLLRLLDTPTSDMHWVLQPHCMMATKVATIMGVL